MQAAHIVWILIGIIVILLMLDMYKKNNKPIHKHVHEQKHPIINRMDSPRRHQRSILKQKERPIESNEDRVSWQQEVCDKRAVRFSFSNDERDIVKDQRGTTELDQMYVEARKEVPTDDPYACKKQASSLPFANINPRCVLSKSI